MALTERVTSAVYRSAQTLSTSLGILPFARIPRGAIGRIRRVRISASLTNDLTSVSDAILLLVARIEEDIGVPVDRQIEGMIPIWGAKMRSVFEAGATDTANVVAQAPSVEVVIDFSGSKHRKLEIRNTGSRSNFENGWAIAHYTLTAGTMWILAVIEWEIVYLIDTGPSPDLGWIMDEEQNQ